MIQEEGYFSNPTVERLCEDSCEANPPMGADSTETLGSFSSSSTLGKHPRYPKSADTANKHTKATDNEEIPICQECGRFGHRRDACDLSDHPDFNRSGDWVGSAVEIAIRAFGGRPNQTLISPLESNCSSICEHMERKFRRPLSNILPLLPWMPTHGRDHSGGRGNRDPKRQGGAEARSLLTEAFIQEMVRSV